jgi:predicted nucleic acid-binding protein
MTVGYFDASALVKIFLDEEDSSLAVDFWNGVSVAATSWLTYVEVEAAIAASRRRQGLGEQFAVRARNDWWRIRPTTRAMPLTPAIAAMAGDLVHNHSLSGADAVHLATALAFGADSVVMVTWDRRLAVAALAEGLSVAPAAA